MWIKTTDPLSGKDELFNTDNMLRIGFDAKQDFPCIVKGWTTNSDDRTGCVLAMGTADYCQDCFDEIKLGLKLGAYMVEFESEEE